MDKSLLSLLEEEKREVEKIKFYQDSASEFFLLCRK